MITEIIIKEPVSVTLTTAPPPQPLPNVIVCDLLNVSFDGYYARIEMLRGNIYDVWYAPMALVKYKPRALYQEDIDRMMERYNQ